MANSLTFTSEPFMVLTGLTSGNTTTATNYTILPVDNTNHRRLYSLSVTTSDNAINNVQFTFSSVTASVVVAKLPISISAGTSTTTATYDVLGSSIMAGVVKERDNTGTPFLHIPTGTTIVAQYQSALAANEYINFVLGGQKY